MHWIYLLGFVVIVIAFFALTGVQPKEGRPAPNTRLMTAARVILGLLAVMIAIAYFTGR